MIMLIKSQTHKLKNQLNSWRNDYKRFRYSPSNMS